MTTRDITLTAGDYTATITTRGGGVRTLSYRGAPLLIGYEAGEDAPMNAGNILSPWPNRVDGGVFIFHGTTHELEITEPQRNNAIHGFVHYQEWQCVDISEASVTLELHDGQHQGWPWALHHSVTWSLDEATGLSCAYRVRNASDDTAPVAVGFHPYITAHGAPLDECELTLPCGSYLPLETTRNLPAGPMTATIHLGVNEDVATGIAMDGVFFDHCFSVDKPQQPSAYEVTLRHRDSDASVVLRSDMRTPWLQVFTADPAYDCGYPGVGRALAVEPMSAPVNAFRSHGAAELDPEESLSINFAIAAG
ncbi:MULTISPECIES: aldose epimerase [Corynebacterium]|uniref:aldose epimerase family protein n=1 Tax=Corynebacterium TaxID=1716 RepID=UPI00178C6898|nr:MULTISPECIES: aldose epimerase [Corynebacterium]